MSESKLGIIKVNHLVGGKLTAKECLSLKKELNLTCKQAILLKCGFCKRTTVSECCMFCGVSATHVDYRDETHLLPGLSGGINQHIRCDQCNASIGQMACQHCSQKNMAANVYVYRNVTAHDVETEKQSQESKDNSVAVLLTVLGIGVALFVACAVIALVLGFVAEIIGTAMRAGHIKVLKASLLLVIPLGLVMLGKAIHRSRVRRRLFPAWPENVESTEAVGCVASMYLLIGQMFGQCALWNLLFRDFSTESNPIPHLLFCWVAVVVCYLMVFITHCYFGNSGLFGADNEIPGTPVSGNGGSTYPLAAMGFKSSTAMRDIPLPDISDTQKESDTRGSGEATVDRVASAPPNRVYYVKRGSTVKGPFSLKKIRALDSAKKFKSNDKLSRNVDGPWVRYATVYRDVREGKAPRLLSDSDTSSERGSDDIGSHWDNVYGVGEEESE
ncbi:MAG TPA: hypothetical protein EYG03_07795 [Planctomycetes bacterium]|nr:hypothetical protein [Planctomycetota bacterium]